ncbi:MAG: hypothetical protein KF822_14425, partial [Steroidobacteraceae bacterium]|nr:hypothetical protein [Steroidobacteraceae bacterium]
LDLVGAEIPIQCDGRSLRTFLDGSAPERWRDDVRWEFDFRAVTNDAIDRQFGCSIDELSFAVLRTETEKYVHFAAMPPLYYDLEADPHELHNRAGDAAAAPAMLAMAQRMLDWRIAFNRRELTGVALTVDGPVAAARERRIV